MPHRCPRCGCGDLLTLEMAQRLGRSLLLTPVPANAPAPPPTPAPTPIGNCLQNLLSGDAGTVLQVVGRLCYIKVLSGTEKTVET